MDHYERGRRVGERGVGKERRGTPVVFHWNLKSPNAHSAV